MTAEFKVVKLFLNEEDLLMKKEISSHNNVVAAWRDFITAKESLNKQAGELALLSNLIFIEVKDTVEDENGKEEEQQWYLSPESFNELIDFLP